MSLFVLADTHLSLGAGEEKRMDVFGGRWEGYTARLEAAWRQTVSPGDTVVLPGDISWAMTAAGAEEDLRFLHRLPGEKILVKGNHDFWWGTTASVKRFFAESGLSTLHILFNNAYRAEGYRLCGTRGWFTEGAAPGGADYAKIVRREVGRLRASLACEGEEIGAAGGEARETLAFLHFPPVYGDFVCRELIDALHEGGVRRCYYGHIHRRYDLPRTILFEGIAFTIVSSDYLSFCPMKIE